MIYQLVVVGVDRIINLLPLRMKQLFPRLEIADLTRAIPQDLGNP
jgi:hypothetical protein